MTNESISPAKTEHTPEEYQKEYDRLFAWRDVWTRLGSTFRKGGRLQERQDRIEKRARLANNRIGALMRHYDDARAALNSTE